MYRSLLMILFALSFATILAFTIQATLHRSVFDNARLLEDPWFRATLADAYLGFLTFYVWVAWKEPTPIRRAVWFVLVMTLGNLAMSAYVVWQLWKLKPGEPVSHAWTRRQAGLP